MRGKELPWDKRFNNCSQGVLTKEKTIEELSAELGSRTDTVQRAADEGMVFDCINLYRPMALGFESRSSPSSSSTIPAFDSSSDKPSVPFNTEEMATELLANSDQLPIHSFYERFPR